jgi:hypothetical protein
MQITVKRSGGFAGLTDEFGPVDTKKIDPGTAQKIEGLVSGEQFFTLPAEIAAKSVGADLYHYEIDVIDGKQHHTVSFRDDGGPATAKLVQLATLVGQAQ